MPMTDAEFRQRIEKKPICSQERLDQSMPIDPRGRKSVRVGNRLVPLMPLDAVRTAAAPKAPVLAPLAGAGPPAAVDHTKMQTAVKDQRDRPTCVSFALLAALEALLKRRQAGPDINLSEQYSHWLLMASEGKTQCDSGPPTLQAAARLQQAGVCVTDLCSYQNAAAVAAAGCTAPPSPAAQQHAIYGLGSFTPLVNTGLSGTSLGNTDLLEMLLAQDLDVVVEFAGIFGLTTAEDVLDVFLDGNHKPWPAQAAHTMLAVGYTRDPHDPYFLFKNSWRDPGGNGYMKVSYDYLRTYATAGVVARQVRTDMPVNGAGNGGGGNGGGGQAGPPQV
jgi:hypothetical protein